MTTRLSLLISYFLTLFLFMVAIFLPFMAYEISKHLRSELRIQVVLKKSSSNEDRMTILYNIKNSGLFNYVEYIPPDEGLKKISKEMGYDFIKILGYNPISPIIELRPSPDKFNLDTIQTFIRNLREEVVIEDIVYPGTMIKTMERNFQKAAIILLFLTGIMSIVAITLFRNLILLNLIEKRFLIKIMFYTGASLWFIKKPFIAKSMVDTLLSYIISGGVFAGLIHLLINKEPFFLPFIKLKFVILVYSITFVIAFLISFFTTNSVINSFLKKSLEKLYKL